MGIAGDLDQEPRDDYRSPAITYLGDLADLTKVKEVGAADGEQFLGIDIGTV